MEVHFLPENDKESLETHYARDKDKAQWLKINCKLQNSTAAVVITFIENCTSICPICVFNFR